jgi:hypothetical protein
VHNIAGDQGDGGVEPTRLLRRSQRKAPSNVDVGGKKDRSLPTDSGVASEGDLLAFAVMHGEPVRVPPAKPGPPATHGLGS